MKELSVFVDESGAFGPYEIHSQFYIVTLVLHDQAVDITANLRCQREEIVLRGIQESAFHAGPLIRRDNEHKDDE